jgi:hypothetical protein
MFRAVEFPTGNECEVRRWQLSSFTMDMEA